MKLRSRLMLLALVPSLSITIVSLTMSTTQLKNSIYDEAYTGMEATALAVREVFDNSGTGEYHMVDDCLYKGDNLDISDSTDIVDSIKDSTGFEVTVFYEDTRVLTTLKDANGNRQVGTKANSDVVASVLNKGGTYQSDNVDIFDERYIVFYIPLYQENTKTPVGMIFLGQHYENVQNVMVTAAGKLTGTMIAIVVISLILIILSANHIVGPILAAGRYVHNMSTGKLGARTNPKNMAMKDEVGDMCREIQALDSSLVEIVTAIKNQVDILTETYEGCNTNTQNARESTEQIDETVNGLSLANTSLADDAMAAGDSVTIISTIIENTNDQMTAFSETAKSMEESAKSAQTTLAELNDSMNEVMESVDDVYGKTSETHESVSKIANMVNVISEIASQTNLLSLNASIEAARAGEMGKGFAVVAGEIQSLAEQSDRSAKEIQDILDQLVANSNQSVETMEKMQTMIEAQKNKINDTNQAFTGVGDGIEQTVDGIKNIVTQMDKLSEARNNTSDTVQNVASIAEENAASAQETASNMSEIASQIEDITEQIKELGSVASVLSEKVGAFEILEG